MFHTILVQLGLFGWLAKYDGKCAELVFVPRSRIGTFRKEHTRSTPLNPKLMFWCVSYYFGAFGTIWLPYKTRCKTGLNWCKSSCHEVALEFFTTNAPDPPHWTLNSCSGAFHTNLYIFGTIWLARKNTVQNGPTGAKVHATKSRRNFTQ